MSSFYGNHGSIGSGDGLPSVQPTDEGKALIVQNGEWVPGIVDANGLPNVTANDNGKVLTVVDGQWNVAESSNTSRELYWQTTPDIDWQDVSQSSKSVTAQVEVGSGLIPNDTYIITYDGQEYTLTAQELVPGICLLGEIDEDNGGPSFENYPFIISGGANTDNTVVSIGVEDSNPPADFKIEHIINTSGLPEVTNNDNGKVLTVVDGKWVAFGSENHQILYNQTIDNWIWSPEENLTQQQLVLQDNSNIVPGNTYLVTVDGVEYTLTATEDSDYPGKIDLINESGELPFEIIVHQNSNNPILFLQGDHREDSVDVKIEYIETKSPLLPEVTDNDNGKVLKVVDGKWTIVDPIIDISTLNCLYENILDEEYSSWSETESDQWYVSFGSPVDYTFVSGEKYLITYDDIQYITTAYDIETKYQYIKACQLGNINNSDPMELKWYDSEYGGGHCEVIIPENTGSHKINIKHIIDADISRKVIYDKTISNWNIQGNRIGYSESNLEQPLALISGELYIVTIDETEYIVRANAGNQQEYIDIKDILLGDPDVFVISTNRSSYNTSYENGIVIYTNDSSSHHIKIERLIPKAKIFVPENDGDMLVGIDEKWTPINMLDIETESTILFDYQDGTYDLSVNDNYPTYAPDSVDDIEAILGDYVGKTVIISYDGTDYECPVYSTSGYYMIGNNAEYSINHLADINPGNFEEYPFLFLAVNYDNNWGVNIYSVYDGTHDVTIRTVDETTTVIKSEYLPCQYIEDGTGDYAVIINGVDTLPSTSEYDPGTPKNIASGDWAIAEGKATEASGAAAHAEGERTVASGFNSHAEGYSTLAVGGYSHAEGDNTKAYGYDSHAEGVGTEAGISISTTAGNAAHAEGKVTKAIAEASHTEGEGTIANGKYQHVSGKYNIADNGTAANSWNGTYAEIIGNGTSDSNRSNARTLDWNGNEVLAGGLTVGSAGITIGNTTITEAQLTALLAMLS